MWTFQTRAQVARWIPLNSETAFPNDVDIELFRILTLPRATRTLPKPCVASFISVRKRYGGLFGWALPNSHVNGHHGALPEMSDGSEYGCCTGEAFSDAKFTPFSSSMPTNAEMRTRAWCNGSAHHGFIHVVATVMLFRVIAAFLYIPFLTITALLSLHSGKSLFIRRRARAPPPSVIPVHLGVLYVEALVISLYIIWRRVNSFHLNPLRTDGLFAMQNILAACI
ncbi:hypothetical protein K443DRAFT_120752 [Laccaria amethystina LaAM-08-1]|uniref:Uncharacterized protein n=1 Tax=Laccaria amethystina LaAM-08-1 TaxID=1095629 RepID=A0A0C9YA31_9AGAR|nr:hypothetical protein K443DRAFT_120752 [Laccaria amethystina LaAM-08-1]